MLYNLKELGQQFGVEKEKRLGMLLNISQPLIDNGLESITFNEPVRDYFAQELTRVLLNQHKRRKKQKSPD